MTKMRSLSALAVTLMLAGVLAACGSDKAASPAATDNAEEAIENIPAAADNDAHPTDETDIDMAEESQDASNSEAADSTETAPADSSSTGSESADKTTTDTSSTSTDKTGTSETNTKTDSSASAGKSEDKAPAAAAEQTGKGSYSGLADSHSVEIDVDGQAVTYQLSEEAQKQINQIPNDAKVTFKYTEQKVDDTTTVLTITEIEAAK